MKTLNPVFLFFVFLRIFTVFFTAANAAADNRDRFEYTAGAGLEIHTNPQGAKVFIDGIERGVTPFIAVNLPVNTYFIELRKETYADRSFHASVVSSSRLVVTMEIEAALGFVEISVHRHEGSSGLLPFNPQISARGADKTISSIALSQNNTALTRLPAGNQTIQARAFGWENTSVNVTVSSDNPAAAEIFMKPASFKIDKAAQSRKRFNPLNSGSLGVTEYRFEVTAPGTGIIKISDSDNNIVYTKRELQFNTWFAEISWDGSDSDGRKLPAGSYAVLIEALPLHQLTAEEPQTSSLKFKTEINYSADIFPLSLESGIAGLALAPMPHTLSAGSFQVNAGFIFAYEKAAYNQDAKDDNKHNAKGISFPFKLNFRIAPFERFEMTTVLNLNPYIEHDIGWGASGSLKYNFFDGRGFAPLAFSLGASYSWANNSESGAWGEYVLSSGKGAGFYAPFSLELEKFSVVFCPGAFWRGPEGLVPELLLSAGVLYRGSWLNTGLSARYEYDFLESENYRFLAGAEINFFPAPSNFVYSVQGGVWLKDWCTGFYAGLGIGLIF